MKYFVIVMLSLAACTKAAKVNQGAIIADLDIKTTATPASVSQGQTIVSRVLSSGLNLCYKFSHFEISKTGERQFTIRSKATFPDAQKSDVVCAEAIYYKDTTLSIQTDVKGQYLLHFYNKDQLFKTDAVVVQ